VILQNSLFFSLLAGNLAVETGLNVTASATIQFPAIFSFCPFAPNLYGFAPGVGQDRGPVGARRPSNHRQTKM
jgi:hypothetical protein